MINYYKITSRQAQNIQKIKNITFYTQLKTSQNCLIILTNFREVIAQNWLNHNFISALNYLKFWHIIKHMQIHRLKYIHS